MLGKYRGVVWKVGDEDALPEGEWLLFRFKDAALPATLWKYYEVCKELGASDDHLTEARMLWAQVRGWQERHPDQVKVPD